MLAASGLNVKTTGVSPLNSFFLGLDVDTEADEGNTLRDGEELKWKKM